MTTGLVFAAVLQTALAATPAEDYQAAYQAHVGQGKPLLVLVGADWCPGCRQMKNSVIPQARKLGLLSDVAFATVNTDQDRKLAQKLMRGGSIPQLVLFQQTASGPKRVQLTGAQSIEAIRSLVVGATADSSVQFTGQGN